MATPRFSLASGMINPRHSSLRPESDGTGSILLKGRRASFNPRNRSPATARPSSVLSTSSSDDGSGVVVPRLPFEQVQQAQKQATGNLEKELDTVRKKLEVIKMQTREQRAQRDSEIQNRVDRDVELRFRAEEEIERRKKRYRKELYKKYAPYWKDEETKIQNLFRNWPESVLQEWPARFRKRFKEMEWHNVQRRVELDVRRKTKEEWGIAKVMKEEHKKLKEKEREQELKEREEEERKKEERDREAAVQNQPKKPFLEAIRRHLQSEPVDGQKPRGIVETLRMLRSTSGHEENSSVTRNERTLSTGSSMLTLPSISMRSTRASLLNKSAKKLDVEEEG